MPLEVEAPRPPQCLLAAEQWEGTGTALQDKSPAKTEREGMIEHFETESTPKGAKYAGPLGHMPGVACRLSCSREQRSGA
jgi:hypothetical protein